MEPTNETSFLKIHIKPIWGFTIIFVLLLIVAQWAHVINLKAAQAEKAYTESIEIQKKLVAYATWQREVTRTFQSLPLLANHVEIVNTSRGNVLFEKGADNSQALASVTKLMTALLVTENISPDEKIIISPQALLPEGDNGLIENEIWSRDDLLAFMLIVSSNDAAQAFAETISNKKGVPFTQLMNDRAKELGLSSLIYRTPSGLDVEKTPGVTDPANAMPGGYGNAQDVSRLAEYILKTSPLIAQNSVIKQKVFTATKDGVAQTHIANNTNDALPFIPNPLLSKTGYTLMANGNLVFAFRTSPQARNQTIIVTLLGSTIDGRFTDAARIASSTEALLRKEPERL